MTLEQRQNTNFAALFRRKIPVWVETQEQAVECARTMNDAKYEVFLDLCLHQYLNSYLLFSRTCPVFMVSNVTGKNLPHLRTLLNCLKTSQGSDKYTTEGSFEFSISDCFSVPFVGAVAVSSSLLRHSRPSM